MPKEPSVNTVDAKAGASPKAAGPRRLGEILDVPNLLTGTTTSSSDSPAGEGAGGWTCGRCGRLVEPVVYEIARPGHPPAIRRVVPARCPCEVEEWERGQVSLAGSVGGIPGRDEGTWPGAALGRRFAGCRLSNFERRPGTERALQEAQEFLGRWDRQPEGGRDLDRTDPAIVPGLFLSGDVGAGKTRLVATIANELALRHGVRAAVWPVPELLERLRRSIGSAGEGEDRLESVRRARCLILDDIGAERLTDWIQERLYLIIDFRYREGLPTLFTSNLTLKELTDQLSHRIASRIIGMARLVLMQDAGDYRVVENRRL